jgi:hypothetical protein
LRVLLKLAPAAAHPKVERFLRKLAWPFIVGYFPMTFFLTRLHSSDVIMSFVWPALSVSTFHPTGQICRRIQAQKNSEIQLNCIGRSPWQQPGVDAAPRT